MYLIPQILRIYLGEGGKDSMNTLNAFGGRKELPKKGLWQELYVFEVGSVIIVCVWGTDYDSMLW